MKSTVLDFEIETGEEERAVQRFKEKLEEGKNFVAIVGAEPFYSEVFSLLSTYFSERGEQTDENEKEYERIIE